MIQRTKRERIHVKEKQCFIYSRLQMRRNSPTAVIEKQGQMLQIRAEKWTGKHEGIVIQSSSRVTEPIRNTLADTEGDGTLASYMALLNLTLTIEKYGHFQP